MVWRSKAAFPLRRQAHREPSHITEGDPNRSRARHAARARIKSRFCLVVFSGPVLERQLRRERNIKR